MKLNPKQLAFVDEYLISRNAIDAYVKAGYKGKTEHSNDVCARRLLQNVVIAQMIDDRTEKQFKATDITVESILMRLDAMADKTIAKDTDRIKALELLGKYRKLFTEKTEVSGSIDVGVNIIDDI